MREMAPEQRADTASMLAADVRLPKHVVYRAFVYETVVLNLETGTYHGLNPVAGRMLELLDRHGSVSETVAQLVAEYGRPQEEIEADLGAFCSDLVDRGLIELSNDPG
jgi:Coenzyme PQQ synthesis protein D (PqqD)